MTFRKRIFPSRVRSKYRSRFRSGLVLVEPDHFGDISQLHAHRKSLGEIHEIVVEKWDTRVSSP